MGEFISKGTKLSVATVPTGSAEPSYKKLYGLFSVPEMEGAPDQIDITNLQDVLSTVSVLHLLLTSSSMQQKARRIQLSRCVIHGTFSEDIR